MYEEEIIFDLFPETTINPDLHIIFHKVSNRPIIKQLDDYKPRFFHRNTTHTYQSFFNSVIEKNKNNISLLLNQWSKIASKKIHKGKLKIFTQTLSMTKLAYLLNEVDDMSVHKGIHRHEEEMIGRQAAKHIMFEDGRGIRRTVYANKLRDMEKDQRICHAFSPSDCTLL